MDKIQQISIPKIITPQTEEKSPSHHHFNMFRSRSPKCDVQSNAKLEKRLTILERQLGDILSEFKNLKEICTVDHPVAEQINGIVGLKEALANKHWAVKYTWIFLFVLGIAFTAFYIFKTTTEYLDEPTATKIKLNVSAGYDLPSIAICPEMWMDTEAALSDGMTLDALKYSLGYIDTYPMQFDNVTRARSEFRQFYSSRNFSSLLQYFKYISLDLATVYSAEAFDNSSTVIRLGDNKASFAGKFFVSYEMCNAYSSKPTGQNSYSTLIFYTKFYDRTLGVINTTPGLWLHLISDLNFLNTIIPPIYVPTSTRSKVLITTKRFVVLDKPDSPCVQNSDVPPTYSAFACTVDCRNKMYKDTLKCQQFKYAFVSEAAGPLEYCNFLDNLISNQKFDQFRGSDKKEKIAKLCLDACPSKCDRVIWQMFVQWQQVLPDLEPIAAADTNRSKKIYAELYVEHIAKYEGEVLNLIEVKTYSFTELVNNVGGTLGLFVGATLMTFAQLILFLVEYFVGKPKQDSENTKL